MKLHAIALVLTVASASFASVAEKKKAPPDPIAFLLRFEGTWEVVSGAPEGGKLGTIEFKVIAQGKGLYSLFKMPGPEGTYEAHAIWAYDPVTRKFYLQELNSVGDVLEHTGKLKGPNTLDVKRKSRKGKPKLVQTTTITFQAPDLIINEVKELNNGKWNAMTMKFVKR